MTKIILLTLALLSAATPSFAFSEQDRAAFAAMHCDINDERAVEWAALGQTVTLKTHLSTHPDGGYPSGKLSIILENGTEIDLGGGSKYIDDGPIEALTDCQKHFSAAINDTVYSLSPDAVKVSKDPNIIGYYSENHFPTLQSLWAYTVRGQDCMDAMNLEGRTPSYECEHAADYHERLQNGLLENDLSSEDFAYLRENNAPLITVSRSTYYSETLVYDARNNTVHVLYYTGC